MEKFKVIYEKYIYEKKEKAMKYNNNLLPVRQK